MNKKSILFTLVSLLSLSCYAQDKGTNAVRKFGNILNEWSQRGGYTFLKSVQNVCAGDEGNECRVSDPLILEFERQAQRPLEPEYFLANYIADFHEAMRRGNGIKVQISNIKEATNIVFDNESMTDEKRKSLYYVSCDINVSGAMNFTSNDLFFIRKGSGKISQIRPNDGPVNTSRIDDWDHIAAGEFNSIEASYGYSRNFPLNVGIAASFSYFNIGLEYGQNFDKEPIITKQHTNFASSLINGKYFYLMASPGVFLRFATISCGLGATMAKYHYESVYDSYNENKTFFTMKPKLAFNLPLPVDFKSRNEKCYLCPYVGYLFAPKFSKLNNLEFGIGLRFRFND